MTIITFVCFTAVPASPPRNVVATVLSSTEIQVSWTEVLEIDQNGIITEYEVMCEPLMTFGGQITALTVNTTNLSITLMDLEEYVEYNISVRAYTSVGSGPYSVGIVRRTLEDGKFSSFVCGNFFFEKKTEVCFQSFIQTCICNIFITKSRSLDYLMFISLLLGIFPPMVRGSFFPRTQCCPILVARQSTTQDRQSIYGHYHTLATQAKELDPPFLHKHVPSLLALAFNIPQLSSLHYSLIIQFLPVLLRM